MSPTSLKRPIVEKGCIYNFCVCVCVCVCGCVCVCVCGCVCGWSMGATFQNLSPHEILKMGLRSSKSNQFLFLSQQYSCTSLVKINPFILEIGCRQAIFQQSEPSCDLENGVKVTKI